MRQIMNERALKTSLNVMFLLDAYTKPLKHKLDLYCYSIFIGKAVRKKTYYRIFDIQPVIDKKRIILTINI